jgi:hypothetical protein
VDLLSLITSLMFARVLQQCRYASEHLIPNQSLIATHGDPPKSPFKRGTLNDSPFCWRSLSEGLRGARADLIGRINFLIWYKHQSA